MPKKHFMNLFFSCYNGAIVNHAFVLMIFLKAIYETIYKWL